MHLGKHEEHPGRDLLLLLTLKEKEVALVYPGERNLSKSRSLCVCVWLSQYPGGYHEPHSPVGRALLMQLRLTKFGSPMKCRGTTD